VVNVHEYVVNFSILISIIYVTGFLYKHLLVNSREKFIEATLIVIAVFAGWCSMEYGIHLNDSVIFDLRFIPIIIATMYTRNLFYIPIIGIGIGLARFSFGFSPAAISGLYTILVVSAVGMLLSYMGRKWKIQMKMIVVVISLNLVNSFTIGIIGVIPFEDYMRAIVPTVLPINILLSFILLWMVKDLSDEYINKINLLNSSRKDPLTQLYNRRALMSYYDQFTSGKTDVYPLSMAFIDIDHFKKINDQYGHLVGDIVLQKMSQIIAKNLRSVDVIARYGGEEFVVLLPNCDQQEVHHVIERIRKIFEENPIEANDFTIRITLSAGIATSPKIKPYQLLKKADDALYKAKEKGRNQVQTANI